MRTEPIFVSFSCIRIKDKCSREKNLFKPPSKLPTDPSKVVPLLKFFLGLCRCNHMWCLFCRCLFCMQPCIAVYEVP